MTRDLVSVVTAAYNGERFIRETIESALAQTYRPVEIIVVDNNSTDATPAILASFGDRIRVIQQPNSGHAGGRRRGVQAAQGEFIAFLDHDDVWLPDKIARQIAVFRQDPQTVFVYTARDLIDASGRTIAPVYALHPSEGRCLAELAAENFVTDSSVVVRRDVLSDDMLTGNPEYSADWDLWLQLAARGSIRYIADPLTKYRQHEDAMSRNTVALFSSELQVVDRLLARESDPTVRGAAIGNRHWLEIELAHAYYEQGDYASARTIFKNAGTPRRTVDWVRYASTRLPDWLRSPLRRVSQTLRP